MNHLTIKFTGLLLGALAVFGCQREPVEVNPNFDPEKDEVNAAFVFSVATGDSSPSTKMSAANVQKNTNFLGIDSVKLFLFSNPQTNSVKPFVDSNSVALTNGIYDLGAVLTPGAIVAADNATSSSNRVLQLSIPLGADAALIYGKAHLESSANRGNVQGYLDFDHLANNPKDTWFGVTRRIGNEDNLNKYDATGRLMIFAINTILQTSVPATTGHYTVAGYTSTGLLPAVSWKELGHQWEVNNNNEKDNPYHRTGETKEQKELERSMGKAYALFTHIDRTVNTSTDPPTIVFNEFRAGSSAAVKAMIQALYDVISHTAGATPLNDPEANAIRLAEAAITNVNKFFKSNWTYQDISDIYANVVTNGHILTPAEWNDSETGFLNAQDLNDYPYKDFGIPEGAAQLVFDPDTDIFSYTNPNKALVTPGASFDPRKYLYAPELVYYVNSPLWITSKSPLSVADFPNGTGPWNDITSEESKWVVGNWTIGSVASDTRGVAVRDNVNYGVSMLETTVDWTTAAAADGLLDNRHSMTGTESDRTIPVADAHFTLRGVLIGGVHPRYNWQFLPRKLTAEEAAAKTASGDNKYGIFDGVIYDDAIPNTAVPNTASPNYTLVFDNLDYTKVDAAEQNPVNVALEFVNNGDAFWGRDNLIPSGGVFYLGARLTLGGETQANNSITWPTDHQVPPIYETGDNKGKSKKIPRIFIQDFLTKATFRIGVNSLKQAYYSVPDLASSQMSFGLSVDLSWESGYSYDLEFGAGDAVPVTPVVPNP